MRQSLKNAASNQTAKAILLDDNAKDFLDNQKMKKVMADTAKLLNRKLDILGTDTCLMSMAEVGYQIRASADYTVGSEQTEPGAGWPYETILGALAKNPAMTPRDSSALIVDKYLASHTNADSVTYSACDLSKAGANSATTTACQDVVKAVKSGHVMAQGYKGANVNNSNGVAMYFPLRSVSPPPVRRVGFQQEDRLGCVPQSLSQCHSQQMRSE